MFAAERVIVMVYMFLAEGFEEVEALCPLDLIRRAGVKITTVGVGTKVVRGSHGIEVIADITTAEAEKMIEKNPPEMVILPGGLPGTTNLQADRVVNLFIEAAEKRGAWLAAICAAPMILGELGLLEGKEAICYPGFEKHLKGAKISDKKVVTDGKCITGKGMGVALEFGLALVTALVSGEKADELHAAVQA